MNRDERFEGFRFLIRDRGSNFTASFDAVSQATGATILRTAASTSAPPTGILAMSRAPAADLDSHQFRRKSVLNGLINEYMRAA